MNAKLKKYLIGVGIILAVFLLMRGCGGFKDIASIFGELNKQDTVIKVDTVVRYDTVVSSTTKYIPVKVIVNRHDTTVMTVERLIADTTIAVTVDSAITDDLRLKYTAYGNLMAIGFDYTITKPDVIKTVTVTKTLPDFKYHLWLGGFSSATLNHWGVSAGLTKQKVNVGLQYSIPDNSIMYHIQYNIK